MLQYDSIKLDDHWTFFEEVESILARNVKQVRPRTILLVKV